LEPSFPPESFPFRPDRPDFDLSAFEAHFMALQHDAVPWIAAQKRKGEKDMPRWLEARGMPVSQSLWNERIASAIQRRQHDTE